MRLEYLIIFESSGIPIYSHCFGGFCANIGMEESLLSGFLSALNSMPRMFGQGERVQSIEMDYSKLIFSHTDSGKIMVIGVNKETYDDKESHAVKGLFYKMNRLIEEEFGGVNWQLAESNTRSQFEHRLVDNVLANIVDGSLLDCCETGDDCMLDVETSHDDTEIKSQLTLWEKLGKRYEKVTGKTAKLVNIIFSPMVKLWNWWENRNVSTNKQRTTSK